MQKVIKIPNPHSTYSRINYHFVVKKNPQINLNLPQLFVKLMSRYYDHIHYRWVETMTFAMYGDCRKMVLPPSRLLNAEAINNLDAEIADEGCRNLVS